MQGIQAENAWRRCLADQFYFYKQCQVRGKPGTKALSRSGLISFDIYDWQTDLCNDIDDNEILGVLKARRIGFSEMLRLKMVWHAIKQPNTEIFVVSKTEKLAKRFVAGLKKHTWKSLPPWMVDRAPKLLNPAKGQYLEFDNGSMILSEAQGGEPARGETADFIFLDEFDFYEDPESVWAACLEACDGGGRLIFGGTVKQPGRLFHRMWEAAEEGRAEYRFKFYGCFSIPSHDGDWYEAKKRAHAADPRKMYRENPRTPTEAFMQSVANVFDHGVLKLASSRSFTPWRGDINWNETNKKWEITPREAGDLRIWERPHPDHTYVIGADPARGLISGDYSCAQVFDRQTGNQVAQWHGKCEADLFGTYCAAIGEYYNWAYVAIEANHSTSAIDTMRRLGYPNMHRYIPITKVKQVPETRWGFYMTAGSKNRIKDSTQGALRAGARWVEKHDGQIGVDDTKIVLLDDEIEARADALKILIMCIDTKKEMESFVYMNDRGAMEAQPHDDRVMGVMIATEMLRYVREKPQVVEEAPNRVEYGTHEFMSLMWETQKDYNALSLQRPGTRVHGKNRGGRSGRSPKTGVL